MSCFRRSYLGEKVEVYGGQIFVFLVFTIKSITTGEGGMVTTNNVKFATKLIKKSQNFKNLQIIIIRAIT